MANSKSSHFSYRLALLLPLTVLFLSCSQPISGQMQTKYGDVAKRVAMMLQDDHFNRHKFNDAMSANVLDTYIGMLDPRRVYFIQSDIDAFTEKYGDKIDDQVKKNGIPAANEIYGIYLQRVGSHVKYVGEVLENEKFTFNSDRTVRLTRKDAPWSKTEAEQKQIWKNLIEVAMLRDALEADAAKKTAEEKGEKPKKRKDPKAKILKRYQDFHKDVVDSDTEDVSTMFLKAMARSYDPHSEYFSQSQYDNFRINMSKNLKGIGAMLSIDEDDDVPVVEGLVIGGPAHKGGELRNNDHIIGVGQGEGEIVDVVGKKLPDTVELIRGEKGTIVTLRIRRRNISEPFNIKIRRDQVDLKESLATADLIETLDPKGNPQKIGWLRLPSFYSSMDGGKTSMTQDVRRLLSTLIVKGMDGLVIDLRDNGGGSLEEAIKMTGLFIKRGPVVQTVDWRGAKEQRSSRIANAFYDGPMLVLTNRASASASEIFAAALQDYQRAVVIGEKTTFGKGTVQQLRGVYNSRRKPAGALKFTIQTFYRINGDSTQLKGVIPDLQLPSIYDIEDFGESSLKNPLKVQPIPKARYKLYNTDGELPIDILRETMNNRLAKNKDFTYIASEVAEGKKRIAENQLSLNKAVREAEDAKENAKHEAKKNEKIARFAKMRKDEEGLFSVYTITLDNYASNELTKKSDISTEEMSGMARSKDEQTEEEKQAEMERKKLEYPHLLDTYERETIRILQDFIAIKQTGRPVKFSAVSPANDKMQKVKIPN